MGVAAGLFLELGGKKPVGQRGGAMFTDIQIVICTLISTCEHFLGIEMGWDDGSPAPAEESSRWQSVTCLHRLRLGRLSHHAVEGLAGLPGSYVLPWACPPGVQACDPDPVYPWRCFQQKLLPWWQPQV